MHGPFLEKSTIMFASTIVDASGWLARIGDEVLFLQVEVQWTWSFGAESVYHREGIEKDSDQKNFGTKHGITEGMLPTIQ